MTDTMPCNYCKHFGSNYPPSVQTARCRRWPDKPDIVYGSSIGKRRSCYSERSFSLLDAIFGRDKCGPKGKYFERRNP